MRLTCFLVFSVCAASQEVRHEAVVFSAMGCGPYNAAAEKALAEYVPRENRDPKVEFIVHLGDIVSGEFGRGADKRPDHGEAQYAKVAALLWKGNRIPTFAVPGDNEWVDRANPAVGWALWKRHFLKTKKPTGFGPDVVRQKERAENFAFAHKGVLFVGVNHVKGPSNLGRKEWDRCEADGARWLSLNLGRHKAVRAAVVFAQAAPKKPLADALRTAGANFGKPILYLQADLHKWLVFKGQPVPNVIRVVTDSMSPKHPAVHVTVGLDAEKPFSFNRNPHPGK